MLCQGEGKEAATCVKRHGKGVATLSPSRGHRSRSRMWPRRSQLPNLPGKEKSDFETSLNLQFCFKNMDYKPNPINQSDIQIQPVGGQDVTCGFWHVVS